MAGAGRRTFQPGEVLTASNVNSYLMDQSVMRFANSAARGSAVGTAVIAEGMVSYLDDTDQLDVYDGSAWVQFHPYVPNAGSILQVSHTQITAPVSTTSTSFVDVAGVTLTLTPKNALSKFLVFVSGIAGNSTNGQLVYLNLVRGSTAINQSTGSSISEQSFTSYLDLNSTYWPFAFQFLDSPATSSAVTYKLQFRANANTAYIGRRGSSADRNVPTNITVMEIAG